MRRVSAAGAMCLMSGPSFSRSQHDRLQKAEVASEMVETDFVCGDVVWSQATHEKGGGKASQYPTEAWNAPCRQGGCPIAGHQWTLITVALGLCATIANQPAFQVSDEEVNAFVARRFPSAATGTGSLARGKHAVGEYQCQRGCCAKRSFPGARPMREGDEE